MMKLQTFLHKNSLTRTMVKVWAQRDLIFFIAALMVICFGSETKNIDDTLMLQLLLSSAYTVKDFSVSHTAPPASRLRVQKRLGEGMGRTADPKQPKGYPIAYDGVLSNKSWQKEGGRSFEFMAFVFPSNCYAQ